MRADPHPWRDAAADRAAHAVQSAQAFDVSPTTIGPAQFGHVCRSGHMIAE
jgi:hypothetical protein